MSRWIDRLNRLDERTGAERVGQAMRLYGIVVAWPLMIVVLVILGVMYLVDGQIAIGLGVLGFSALPGLLLFFGVRAERSYRRYRAARPSTVTEVDPPVFDIR